MAWPGIWKEHDWEIGNKEVWERGIQIDYSEWANIVKTFFFPVDIKQRMNSEGKDFNNQVNGMTYSVDTSHPISPATHHHSTDP